MYSHPAAGSDLDAAAPRTRVSRAKGGCPLVEYLPGVEVQSLK